MSHEDYFRGEGKTKRRFSIRRIQSLADRKERSFTVPSGLIFQMPEVIRMMADNRGEEHEFQARDFEHDDTPFTAPIDRLPQDQEIVLFFKPVIK